MNKTLLAALVTPFIIVAAAQAQPSWTLDGANNEIESNPTTAEVGIGTTSPNTKLNVKDGRIRQEISTDANHAIELWNTSSGKRWNLYQLASTNGFLPNGFLFEYYDGIFHNNRAAFDASGNFLIGTTTYPGGTPYRLIVSGTGYITAGVWTASDARFKQNITPLTGALNKVMNLQGVTYQWRKSEFPEQNFPDGTEIGFIAQDLEKVVPEAVRGEGDASRAVSYQQMIPLLSQAIKEQQAIIDQQSSLINQQSARISNLEAALKQIKSDGRLNSIDNITPAPTTLTSAK
jgi:Chaperone of endosialidase